MPSDKRKRNLKKYPHYEELPQGKRKYWRVVVGRNGWTARYVKIVDDDDVTLEFYQEIFDEEGALVELHEKFPVDKGHKKL